MHRALLYAVVAIIAVSPLLLATTFDAAQTAAPFGAPQVEKFRPKTVSAIADLYAIRLDDRISGLPGRFSRAENIVAAIASTYRVPRVISVQKHAINGFIAEMSELTARVISQDPRVLYVEQASYGTLRDVQPNPPWGLDRIDQQQLPLDSLYHYELDGTGVRAYVLDSGIRGTHQEFGDRVVESGQTQYAPADSPTGCEDPPPPTCEPGNPLCPQSTVGGFLFSGSHGTQVASLIGGNDHGVAKNVTLVSVKISNNCQQIIGQMAAGGIDWAVGHHLATGGPAVMNLSWGTSSEINGYIDDAVNGALGAGITVVAAAGNEGEDAGNKSPNVVTGVILVGASTMSDTKLPESNTGTLVDLFAPGVVSLPACVISDTCYETSEVSGTSFASPHVAGVVARFLQQAPWAPPAHVHNAVVNGATPNVLGGTLGPGSPNRLLHTAFLGDDEPSPGPDISSISPTTGPPSGGTAVTISGSGFTGVTSVTIGGTSVAGLSVDSSTTITGFTPAGDLGSANVVVITSEGADTLVNGFTYTSGGSGSGADFVNGDLLAFETFNGGQYVTAANGGGGGVTATSTSIEAASSFELVDLNGNDLEDGDDVALIAGSGHYLSAENGGGGALMANETGIGAYETFEIENISRPGQEILPGDEVAILSHTGHFVVAENGGGDVVNANRVNLGNWETFRIWHGAEGGGGSSSGQGQPPPGASAMPEDFGNDAPIALQADDGTLLIAVNGGGGAVLATSTAVGPHETFVIDDANGGDLMDLDEVTFRTATGHYLMAVNGGGGTLDASVNYAHPHIRFYIVNVSHPGNEVRAGNVVALTSDDYYVVAENGGGGAVHVNSTSIGPREQFRIWWSDGGQ